MSIPRTFIAKKTSFVVKSTFPWSFLERDVMEIPIPFELKAVTKDNIGVTAYMSFRGSISTESGIMENAAKCLL